MSKVYCVDLDGTLCETDGMHYFDARPKPDAIACVNELYEDGHRIVIDTARGSATGLDWTSVTRAQLEEWGVKYHRLRCGEKIPADVYVDDRAVRPEEWMDGG